MAKTMAKTQVPASYSVTYDVQYAYLRKLVLYGSTLGSRATVLRVHLRPDSRGVYPQPVIDRECDASLGLLGRFFNLAALVRELRQSNPE